MGLDEDVDRGTPGGSLLRTYERDAATGTSGSGKPPAHRRTRPRPERRARDHGFQRGAHAEARVAELLQRRCGPDVEFLFNRRLSPRGRNGDIDVLAVSANGVHLIDVKRYRAARVRVRRSGGVLSPVREQLLIGGRDRTRLLDSLQRQHEVVPDVLDRLPDGESVPSHLALCFVDGDLPLLTGQVNGVALLGPRGTARRLRKRVRSVPTSAARCCGTWRGTCRPPEPNPGTRTSSSPSGHHVVSKYGRFLTATVVPIAANGAAGDSEGDEP